MARLRRFLTTGRARWVVASLGALAVAGALYSQTGDPEPPADLQQLEEAGEAGSRASRQRDRITRSLERIAENLEAGAGLSEASDEIHELTERQQRSLADLADLLQGQLDSIRRTGEILDTSEESARNVEAIGEAERERIQGTIASLRILEDATRSAVARSADLARQAVYGARLAEDSADSFSRRP